MASLVYNLDLNHLSTSFAGADFFTSTQPPGLARASVCQTGRRDDVMVHRVLKFFFVLLLSFFLFFFVFLFFFGDVIYHNPSKVCDFTGSTTLSSLMEKLESVQYFDALAITGAWRGTSREKLYLDLGWESLSLRRWSRRLTLFYKVVNNSTDCTRNPLPPLLVCYYSRTFFT